MHETYWPDKSDNAFDVVLIEVFADHVNQALADPPFDCPLYDTVNLEAVKIVVHAETRLTLNFDIEIPSVGLRVDGEPTISVTVMLETRTDNAVHITMTDDGQDSTGIGTAPRIG